MRLAPSLVAVALLIALPRPAAASKCDATSFAAQIDAADFIFAGRALEIDTELATTFDVERIYKGDTAARVVVTSHRNKYAALEPPHRYLVLALREKDTATPGALYVHPCSGSLREPFPVGAFEQLPNGTAPATSHDAPAPAPAPATSPAASSEPPPVPARRGCSTTHEPALLSLLVLALASRRRTPTPASPAGPRALAG